MTPTATYRLQMHAGFTLADAIRIVPYLHALGISHVYTSSLLTAKPGSTHGYDVIDHGHLNPEIGTDDQLKAFSQELKSRGMGLILDVVPNHMSVGGANAWWHDVLENGPSSAYANFFDIAWNDHYRESLRGKVLLPILGASYGEAIDGGQITLDFADGAFGVQVDSTRLPVDPRSYGLILDAVLEELKAAEPTPGTLELQSIATAVRHLPPRGEQDAERVAAGRDEIAVIKRRLHAWSQAETANCTVLETRAKSMNADPLALDALIEAQAYRPCFWRVASDEINYRRFFDVNDLAAVATERPEVFDGVHRLIFQWIRDGIVDGLRIDHPDGLYDPQAYLERLKTETNSAYVVVEKILGPREKLPSSWACAGTTGYEFLNTVNGLFIDPAGEAALTRAFHDFTGVTIPFDELVYRKKLLILHSSLTSELHVLAGHFDRLAQMDRRSRDFTLNGLRHALRELLCNFPIYRTYVDGSVRNEDAITVVRAARQARRRNALMGRGLFDFLRDTLLLKDPPTEEYRAAQARCAAKFQQLSAPVMAKGFEDTALFIYNRLTSLNEVGGEPKAFGHSPAEVHATFAERSPGGLSPLATHDTKRGEDTRARLNVLSEVPEEWIAATARWHALTEDLRIKLDDDLPAPDANEEYLLYQTLVGTWPVHGAIDDDYRRRIRDTMAKCIQEAKVHTSWINPDANYLAAIATFVDRVLTLPEFIADVNEFVNRIAPHGFLNSLAQTLIRGTAPGVPDTYQGTEFWSFDLVDPDNRRPVDYDARIAALQAIDAGARFTAASDDRTKLFVTATMLRLRREEFFEGTVPLEVEGPMFAYLRTGPAGACLVAVPRHTVSKRESTLTLPPEWRGRTWTDAFSGREVNDAAGMLTTSELFAEMPVALLTTPRERP